MPRSAMVSFSSDARQSGSVALLAAGATTPPLAEAVFRYVRVATKHIPPEPFSVYKVKDAYSDAAFDNVGDMAGSVLAGPRVVVGEVDTADGNAIVKLVAKYKLPPVQEASHQLESAILRIFLEETEGSPAGPVSLFHSVSDNDFDQLPSDFEDTGYSDTSLDLVQPTDMGQAYYELDVTDLVLADYAADGTDLLSAFRLQVNEAFFLEDDQSHRYRFTMPGAETNHPELVLTFIPEPSTLLLCLIATGLVGAWRKWDA